MSNTSGVKALKSGAWYTVGNFLMKGAGFLTMPIFTRLMTTEAVGDFSNMLSWVGILAIVATFELFSSIGVARFDFKDELNEYMSSTLVLGLIITSGFYALCLVFKDFFLSFFSFTEFELHLAFVYLLTYPALQMYQSQKQIHYEYKTSVLLSMTSVLSSTLLSLLFVALFEDKLLGRMVGYFVPMIVLNLVIGVYIIARAPKISSKYWGYAVKIAAPLIVHLLAGNLLNSSDRVMIKNMCGSSEAAFYTVAYSCAVIVQVLWQSMNSAWSPWAYEMLSKENYQALYKASKPYMLFFGFVSLCFLLVGPEVLWLMGGEEYMGAVGVIPPVLAAYVLQFIYSLYVNVEFFYKKQKYIACGTIVAAVVNVGLNAVFIPMYGYIAAAYTTLVGYLVLFLIHFAFTVKMKKHTCFDTKFIFAFVGAFVAIMFVSLVLYKITIVRYVLIAVIAVITLAAMAVFRNGIIYFLKNKSMQGLKDDLANLRKKLAK